MEIARKVSDYLRDTCHTRSIGETDDETDLT